MSYTLQQDLGTPPTLNAQFGSDVGGQTDKWVAGSFLASASYTLTQVGVKLQVGGGAPLTSAVTCYIYSDGGQIPLNVLGTSSNTHSDTIGGAAYYTFQFVGVSLTISTRYHVVLKIASCDNVNYPAFLYAVSGSERTYEAADGSTWSVYTSNSQMTFQLYSSTGSTYSITSTMTLPALGVSCSIKTRKGVLLPPLGITGVLSSTHVITGTVNLPPLKIYPATLTNPLLTYIAGQLPPMAASILGGAWGTFGLGKIRFTAIGRTGIEGNLQLNLAHIKLALHGISQLDATFSANLKLFFNASGHVGSVYKCMVLNLRNNALTNYLNYNFNSLCNFNGRYVGINDSGIFGLDGDTDNGVIIPWQFVTGFLDLEGGGDTTGRERFKNKLRYCWLGYNSSGDLTLSVYTSDGLQYDYAVQSVLQDANGALKVKLGKGIKSRYVQIGMSNIAGETIILDKLRVFTEQIKLRKR